MAAGRSGSTSTNRSLVPLGPTVAFAILFLILNVGNALYAARAVTPSPLFILGSYLALAWLFSYWMRADHVRLGTVDSGWFAMLLWPVFVPRHLIKTRGWKGGLLLLGALLLLYGLAYAVSVVVFFRLRPEP